MKLKNILISAGAAVGVTAGIYLATSPGNDQTQEKQAAAAPITHTSHWKEYKPGGYWVTNSNLKDGDTAYLLKGNYTYISGENLNNVTFLGEPGVVLSAGFNFTNSSNLKFDGGTKTRNIQIKGAGGVALSFKGKCNNIKINGVDIDGAYSYLWYKTEIDDFGADTSYWHIKMNGLYVTNCTWTGAKFDGVYVGSTNQQANRKIVINGKTYYPLPADVANIRFTNVYITGSYRTGMQISGCTSGTNWVKNCSIINVGTNMESDHGAALRLGGRTKNFTVDKCIFKNTWLYAFHSQASGNLVFSNNTVDSATAVAGKINPQPMAAVEFDTYNKPTFIKIYKNTIDYSNNNVPVVIYGSDKTLSDTGNVYAENTTKGSWQNKTGIKFSDKIDIPVEPPVDTVPDEPGPPPVVIAIPDDTVKINIIMSYDTIQKKWYSKKVY